MGSCLARFKRRARRNEIVFVVKYKDVNRIFRMMERKITLAKLIEKSVAELDLNESESNYALKGYVSNWAVKLSTDEDVRCLLLTIPPRRRGAVILIRLEDGEGMANPPKEERKEITQRG